MSNSDLFSISDFSENMLLIKMTEKAEYSNRSEVFLSLSEYLRKTIEWAEVFSAEESIAVKYNSLDIPYIDVVRIIQSQLKEFTYEEESVQKYLLSIPVCYSGEFGLDIEEVGAKHALSNQEIADLHSGVTYKVKMIGFTPGFAYLGDLPNKLVMPRLSTPRINLLPGSVGISGNRTGVYTLGGPGGWRIIGRTPLKLFDPDKKNPFGIVAGMQIKFKSITRHQYESFEK
ncbi:MAG: 5-oxoprolinase subunit PxpB [Candidatus Marinimicrobia bacterium]|nr:5-oxoprolinase subunit PxpB [Candidatus Neomarinimicrobiota bacterium]